MAVKVPGKQNLEFFEEGPLCHDVGTGIYSEPKASKQQSKDQER